MPPQRTLKVWGVPEHFNVPWLHSLEELRTTGVDVQWTEAKGGTGEMVGALRDGKADVALLLTEGAVKAAVETPAQVTIVGLYVTSPLVWAVLVGAKSDVSSLANKSPQTVRFAISRKGSGSHLMAMVLAKQLGWDPSALRFLEVGTLDNARAEMAKHNDVVFMWEKAMTQPFVTRNELKRIGQVPTPWPCFVVAANPKSLVTKADAVGKALAVVRKTCVAFKADKEAALSTIVNKFHLEKESAAEWFDKVEFASKPGIPPRVLDPVYSALADLGQVPKDGKTDVSKLVSKL